MTKSDLTFNTGSLPPSLIGQAVRVLASVQSCVSMPPMKKRSPSIRVISGQVRLHSFSVGLTLRAGGFPQVFVLFSWGGNEGTHTIAK